MVREFYILTLTPLEAAALQAVVAAVAAGAVPRPDGTGMALWQSLDAQLTRLQDD